MKNRSLLIRGIVSACAMLVLIFDSKTALISAQEGMSLCIRTIVPSLLPFIVLSSILSNLLMEQKIPLLRPLGRLCKIPKGAESLLILGLLAGYPVGAQLITQAYQNGGLTKNAARHMLGFCSNAGPAFLFGILTPLFSSIKFVWALWLSLILSVLITGWILPSDSIDSTKIDNKNTQSFPAILVKSTKGLAYICVWVILFRIIIGFCNRWFLWLFPLEFQVLFSGLLELSNGSVLLQNIPLEGVRFMLAGSMLSFGGLCVGMQTVSVTEEIGTGWYFPGKVLQTILTTLFCYFLQFMLFPENEIITYPSLVLLAVIIILIIFILALRLKKVVAFPKRLLYNTGDKQSKGASYAVSQKNHPCLRLLPVGYRHG